MKLLAIQLLLFAIQLQAKILYLIRHGEKPVRGPFLSAKGLERAQCLSEIFNNNQFVAPKRIIAQPVDASHRSTRAGDTVRVLSEKLGIQMEETCTAKEYDCVVDSILKDARGPVLISWEHKRLRNILKRFVSKPNDDLPKIPKNRFDIVWRVDTDTHTFTTHFEQCDSFFSNSSGTIAEDSKDADDYDTTGSSNEESYPESYSKDASNSDSDAASSSSANLSSYNEKIADPTTSHRNEENTFENQNSLSAPFSHLSMSRIFHVFRLP